RRQERHQGRVPGVHHRGVDRPAAQEPSRAGCPTMSTDDLVALVRRWEQETPQAPAIVAGDTVLTYGQLGARSDALAHALATAVRDAGGDQSTVVPLVLDRSPDLFVAMLATWK